MMGPALLLVVSDGGRAPKRTRFLNLGRVFLCLKVEAKTRLETVIRIDTLSVGVNHGR